ncbi:MAG: DNA cytosine methyltransferase [Acidobacteriota bacterium]
MSRPLTTVDLFCGAGGLSCGLEMAGLKVLGGFDADAIAHQTFLGHHADSRVREPSDLSALTGEGIRDLVGVGPGEIDVMTGGPPCQGFSMAGNRKQGDVRNTLVFHYVRLLHELRPRFFVMENVVGLLSMKTPGGRPVIEALGEELTDLGYRTNIPDDDKLKKSLIVNAADHGVPQRRRRVLVFGSRDGEPLPALATPSHHDPSCVPIESGSRPYVTSGEALLDLPDPSRDEPLMLEPREDLCDYARWIRDPEGRCWNHIPTNHRPFMVERMKAQEPGTSLYDTWAHSWVRLIEDEPSPTVKENHNAPSVHPVQPRVLTPRECARLQSFPDGFKFEGKKSRQLVQIGNAVPPLLGRAIGEAFLTAAGVAKKRRSRTA